MSKTEKIILEHLSKGDAAIKEWANDPNRSRVPYAGIVLPHFRALMVREVNAARKLASLGILVEVKSNVFVKKFNRE